MHNPTIFLSSFILITALSSCGFTRVGDLTMISTRNIDSRQEYQLIEKYVSATAKSKNGDALQTAIDNAVKQSPDAEYMKNVRVYIKANGKKVKVEGDLWGIPSVEKNVTKSVNVDVQFKVGDSVTFKSDLNQIVEGKIIGVNSNTAIVEFNNLIGRPAKQEIKYEELTKIGE